MNAAPLTQTPDTPCRPSSSTGNRWDTRAQLAQGIFEWIEVFYNQQRRHSTLGIPPVT